MLRKELLHATGFSAIPARGPGEMGTLAVVLQADCLPHILWDSP